MNKLLPFALTLMAGMLVPVQAIVNSRMGKANGGPLMGALMSFGVGMLCLLLVNFFLNADAYRGIGAVRSLPWYVWMGGVIGAFFVSAITWSNQQQGVAFTFVLVVSGQLFASILIDHFGFLGTLVKPVTPQKLLGIGFIIAGIILVRK